MKGRSPTAQKRGGAWPAAISACVAGECRSRVGGQHRDAAS